MLRRGFPACVPGAFGALWEYRADVPAAGSRPGCTEAGAAGGDRDTHGRVRREGAARRDPPPARRARAGRARGHARSPDGLPEPAWLDRDRHRGGAALPPARPRRGGRHRRSRRPQGGQRQRRARRRRPPPGGLRSSAPARGPRRGRGGAPRRRRVRRARRPDDAARAGGGRRAPGARARLRERQGQRRLGAALAPRRTRGRRHRGRPPHARPQGRPGSGASAALRVAVERSEQQLEQPRVGVERHGVRVDVTLQREADVEGDERRGDLTGVGGRLAARRRVSATHLLGADLARAAPEARGQPARVGIAAGMREHLEEQPDHPLRGRVRVDRRRGGAELTRGHARALAGDAAGELEAALLQQRDEELVLRREVRVEGAARVAGLGGDGLDARAGESALDEDPRRGVEQRGARLRAPLGAGHAGRCGHLDAEVYSDTVLYVKRLGLVSAVALVAVNIWTGAPLLALWVGSRFEGWVHSRDPGNGVTMRAVFVVVLTLAALELGLTFALTHLSAAYDELTGRPQEARRTSPWLRSMRGEREEFARHRHGISVVERIVVVCVVGAVLVFEYWFFFLARSSLGNP